VTGTDGGPVPKSARWPEVTTDIAVGQMRQIDFIANEEGDWAFHCHKSHHTMNAMGHDVPNLIGVDHEGLSARIANLVPGYMTMGTSGMADMAQMQMPLPANTAPMMTGDGPFGSVEMGGMFSVFKVRRDLAPGDYRDPGWYRHPAGSVAHEADSAAAPVQAPRGEHPAGASAMPRAVAPAGDIEVQVRKPAGGAHDHH
jgi:manganese oxidase